MSPSLLSRVLRAAGVALLPVVALAVSPDRAAAECGSYVTILDEQGRAHAPGDADHPMPRVPCHGPNCTGGPKAPTPAPPAPTGPAPEAKALTILPARDPGGEFAGRSPPDPHGSALRMPRLVFHPPRTS